MVYYIIEPRWFSQSTHSFILLSFFIIYFSYFLVSQLCLAFSNMMLIPYFVRPRFTCKFVWIRKNPKKLQHDPGDKRIIHLKLIYQIWTFGPPIWPKVKWPWKFTQTPKSIILRSNILFFIFFYFLFKALLSLGPRLTRFYLNPNRPN